MAVLLMPMVHAEASGVAFTRHPVTGADVVVMEAVTGLADRLVAGLDDGERWEVSDGGATADAAAVLTADQAATIADLARRAEQAEGSPQDVEWVLRDGEVLLVQARPITRAGTVAPIPIDEEAPPGPWEWDSTNSQRPNTAYLSSFFPDGFRRASEQLVHEFGLPASHLEMRRIGGYFHIQVVPPMGKPDAAPPPAWLLRTLFRVVPPLRRRERAARRALENRTDREWARRWKGERRPRFEASIREWSRLDLAGLTDDQLAGHIDLVVAEAQDCFRWNMTTDVSYLLPLTALVEFVEEHAGADLGSVLPLLAGVEASDYRRAVGELAAMLTPQQRSAIVEGRPDELIGSEFWDAYELHRATTGCRSLGYDLDVPCHEEVVVDELAAIAARASSPETPEGSPAGADEMRVRLPESLVARFDDLLAEARSTFPIREESEYVHSRVVGCLRRALLVAGERMRAEGAVAEVGDIFHLEQAEVRAWLVGRTIAAGLVDRRKGEYAWAVANPPSAEAGAVAPPDMASFPPAVARVLRAMLLIQQHDMRPAEVPTDTSGVGASPGRYTGPVRRITGPDQFDRIQQGDVVVAPLTTSAWELVFDRIGALVTEGGGLLSHPAIVAREHGLPAVTGLAGAMGHFDDGQTVTVDGTAGTVTVHTP
jgi:phosphohistidine swiveling domain-containing protein